MVMVQAQINIDSNAETIKELNQEIGQLKFVIGLMLAKLHGESGQQVINELESWGLSKSSKEFNQFVNPTPPTNKY